MPMHSFCDQVVKKPRGFELLSSSEHCCCKPPVDDVWCEECNESWGICEACLKAALAEDAYDAVCDDPEDGLVGNCPCCRHPDPHEDPEEDDEDWDEDEDEED